MPFPKKPGLLDSKCRTRTHKIILEQHFDTPDSKGLSKTTSIISKGFRSQMEEAATGQRWDNLSCNKGETN